MTKTNRLIEHFQKGKKITRMTALHEFDIQNVTALISQLRARGMKIIRRVKYDTRKTRYSEYSLA